MIKTILLSSDLGPSNAFLLQHTLSLAEAYEANIIILHVVEPLNSMADAVVKAYLPVESTHNLKQDLERINKQIKCRVVDALEEEFICGDISLSRVRDVKVLSGNPASVISDTAINISADLIVIGNSHQPQSAVNILGSVAQKVLQLAKVPVYTIPVLNQVEQHVKAS